MILHNLVPIILHTTYWVQKIIKQTKGEVKIHCCLKHIGVKAKKYLIRFVLSHMKFTVQSSLNRKHEAVLTVGFYIAKYRWETMKKKSMELFLIEVVGSQQTLYYASNYITPSLVKCRETIK